jgi:hypothetical protein
MNNTPNALSTLAKVLEKAIQEGDKERKIIDVICMAMNRQSSTIELAFDFFDLLQSSRQLANKIDEPTANKHLSSLQRSFVNKNIYTDKWSTIYSTLSQPDYPALIRGWSREYTLKHSSLELSQETLKEIKDNLSQVLSEALNSDINANIRELITKHISEIISAIDHYQMYGIDPIIDAVDKSIGSLVFSPVVSIISRQDDSSKRLVRKVVSKAYTIKKIAINAALPALVSLGIQNTKEIVSFTADLAGAITDIKEIIDMSEGFSADLESDLASLSCDLQKPKNFLEAGEDR